MSLTETEMESLRERMNIDSGPESRLFKFFNRFRIAYPDHELENSHGFVFFTKPDCYMFEKYSSGSTWNTDIVKQPIFHDELANMPEVFLSLQKDQSSEQFIMPFYTFFRNFDTKDEVIKTRTSGETANDWKVMYGHVKNESMTVDTFNINFSDTRALLIYKIIKTWVNYIDLISYGSIKPHHDNRLNKILDYACSAYYFLTAEDGETIIYYAEYKGVFPLNKPDGAFTYDGPGSFKPLEYNIQFQYSMKDTSPAVMRDFMKITAGNNDGTYRRAVENGFMTNTWCSGVYIIEDNGKYKLKFN